jgi:ribosomal protein S18 acetylase RimI-like enzyme
MPIREAIPEDFDRIWPFFHAIVAAGETFAYPPDATKEVGFDLWFGHGHRVFVYEEDGAILGTYFIRQNQPGLGAHVCNCGYMVSGEARGRGVATALCAHSQATAVALGYKAMQYNFVVSTNEQAIRLWQKHGMEIVARLPKAYKHSRLGYVDALVMYKWLAD